MICRKNESKTGLKVVLPFLVLAGVFSLIGFRPAVSRAAVKTPVFSSSSGSYSQSFQLSMNADEGCRVYYSTDGSIPGPGNAGSREYSAPILVQDRNGEPNVLAAQENTNKMYMVPGDPEGYVQIPFISADDVPKATVIRAIAVNSGTGEESKVVTKTFFIGNNLEKYGDTPVISMVTDPKNLLDDEIGILVTGRGMRWADYNYNQSGREWEREANIEYFDENKKFAFSTGAGIRVQGGYNRRQGQKSLNVYFREEYGMKNLSNYRLIPDAVRADGTPVQKYKSFVLRNGGNDGEYTKMRDAFTQSLLSDRNFTTQAGRPCVVYLNGEYWGFYTLVEKYGTNYLEEKYGVNEDNVIIIKTGSIDEGLPEDMRLYDEYREYESMDMSVAENYQEFCEEADIQSFIDYFAAQTFISNEDWPDNNYRLWRTRTVEPGNPYGDGKWRWMMYDTEFAMGLYNGGMVSDGIGRILYNNSSARNTIMFRNLMNNPDFCKQFVTTMMDLCSVNFEYEAGVKKLYEMADVYGLLIDDYYTRFGIEWRNFDDKINEVGSYLLNNKISMPEIYLPMYFSSRTGISSNNLSEVTLTTNYNGTVLPGVSIKLNTVTPDLSAGRWTGRYYSSLPVTVTAGEVQGYEFSGWTVTGGTVSDPSRQTTTVTFNSDTVITADYKIKPLPPGETAAPPNHTEMPPEQTEAPPNQTEIPPGQTGTPPEPTVIPPGQTTAPPEDSPQHFTVTFQSNGGTKSRPMIEIIENSKIKSPDNPKKKGYSFAGWYRDAQYRKAWNFNTDTVSGNITLYAKWKAKTITLTFHANKGKIGGKNRVKIKAVYGKKIKIPKKPKRNYYKFKGWYTKKKGGRRIAKKIKVPAVSKVYYARWK